MKIKKSNKKLSLNKITVASLNIEQLKKSRGGSTSTYAPTMDATVCDWTEQEMCTYWTCQVTNPGCTLGINCGPTHPASPCNPE